MKRLFIFLCLAFAMLNAAALLLFAWKYLLGLLVALWAGNQMCLIYMKEKGITDEDLDRK